MTDQFVQYLAAGTAQASGVRKLQNAALSLALTLQARARKAMEGESGMATIEVLLIIAVLVALALMFKDVIIEFVSNLLEGISSQGSAFDPGAMVP